MEMETKVSGVQRKKSQASYSLSVGSPLFEVEVRTTKSGDCGQCSLLLQSEVGLGDFPPQYQRVNISGEHFTGDTNSSFHHPPLIPFLRRDG